MERVKQFKHIKHIEYGVGVRIVTKSNAGIIPIIKYESNFYLMLGFDRKIKKYSDFGGSFDPIYTEYNGQKNSYKNNILRSYQIKDGKIDPKILLDHKDSLNNDLDLNLNPIGDIDSMYTAFREFIEETSSEDPIFNLETVYSKLYVQKKYIFLGGDISYNYDTYILFFDLEDFDKNSIKIESCIKLNQPIYLNNSEMQHMNAFLFSDIFDLDLRPSFRDAMNKYRSILEFILSNALKLKL